MKIEVKNIKVNLAFSEETTCFKADVFVNGVKTAYAENDGHGGCTNIQPYPNKGTVLATAYAHAKTLPSIESSFGGKPLEMDLELFVDLAIDDYVNAKEKAKFEKKIAKAMIYDIVFGVPNSGSVRRIGYGKTPLARVVMTNRPQVQALLDRIRKEHCKDGVEILNTNLAELGLK